MGYGPNLITRIKQALGPYEAGLCIHTIQDRLSDYSYPKKIPATLSRLVERGVLTVSLQECARSKDEHEFYILVDRPPEEPKPARQKKAEPLEVTAKVPTEDAGGHPKGEDLSNKSVEELAKEIYERTKEIQRRIYGGSWKFQG